MKAQTVKGQKAVTHMQIGEISSAGKRDKAGLSF